MNYSRRQWSTGGAPLMEYSGDRERDRERDNWEERNVPYNNGQEWGVKRDNEYRME